MKIDKQTSSVIKGFGILIIMAAHIVGDFGIRYFTPLGGIGVSMFLFISGYGLNESFKTSGLYHYWRKRFISVYPGYFIASIVAIIINNTFGIKSLVLALVFVNPVIPYGWYFKYLLLWYFVFWCSKYKNGVYQIQIIIVASIVSLLFLPEIMAEQSLSFAMGMVASDNNAVDTMGTKRKCIIAIICLLCGLGFLGLKQLSIVRSLPHCIFNIVQLLIKLPIGVFFIVIFNEFRAKSRLVLLDSIGKISYELYLTHGLVLYYFLAHNIGAVIISLVISFACALILYYLCVITKREIRIVLNQDGN